MGLGRIDLARVRQIKKGMRRDALLVLAEEAQTSERFLDMFDVCGDMIQNVLDLPAKDDLLNEKERRCIAVAFKNVTNQLRVAPGAISMDENTCGPYDACLADYKNHIIQEIVEHCEQCRVMLERLNSLKTLNLETEVFVLKMIADYHRYSAEMKPQSNHGDEAMKHYKLGMEAAASLDPTNPIRMGLALNLSVCQFEIKHNPEAAKSVAKHAFNQAIADLDHIDERHYKDTTLIMQLLRDNIQTWNAEEEGKSHN